MMGYLYIYVYIYTYYNILQYNMGMTFGYSQMLRVGSLFQSIASELGAAVETMSAYI